MHKYYQWCYLEGNALCLSPSRCLENYVIAVKADATPGKPPVKQGGMNKREAGAWTLKQNLSFIGNLRWMGVANNIQQVVGSNSKYTNYLIDHPRNLEHTINSELQWLKPVNKLDSKLQGSGKAGLNSWNTTRKNPTKMKNWKITTAKFKCTRDHILGHYWLIKIT